MKASIAGIRRGSGFFALLIAAAVIPAWQALCADPASARDIDWPMRRHDGRLTAQTDLKGDFKQAPSIAWKFKLEGFRHFVSINDGGSDASAKQSVNDAALPGSNEYFSSEEGRQWTRIASNGRDVKRAEGKGAKKKVARSKEAQLLPDRPGHQIIEWELVKQAQGLDVRQAVCTTLDAGKKTEEWRSEPFDVIQNTNHIIADVDADGVLDVVLAPHYRVIVLDGRTGKTKLLHKVHDHRNYGFVCAVNLDDDPFLEFVILADFAMHMDVIDNDGKSLKTIWRYDFQDNIQSKSRIIRPGPDPVLDLDGDGKKEIIFNYFNESGDERWHVAAYDALTGEKVFDLSETYLIGTADLNGDEKPEIFCTVTSALYTPESGKLRVLDVEEGRAIVKWEHNGGRWLEASQPMPLTHSTIVARGDWNLITTPSGVKDRLSAFFIEPATTSDGQVDRLVSVTSDADGMRSIKPIEDFARSGRLDAGIEGFKENGEGKAPSLLVSFNSVDARVDSKLHGVATDALPVPKRKGVIVTHLEGEPIIIAEAGGHEIVGLQRSKSEKQQFEIKWRQEGVGPVAIADVTGDGKPEAIFSDWNVTGEGEIVARSLADGRIWKHVIAGFPSPDPEWNFGGVTTWSVGHFTDAKRDDIWCSARRSTMHSDQAWVLSTSRAEPIWSRREVRTNNTKPDERGWGCGGSDICAFDVDGDGLDDVVSLYPVNYMAAKGTDGSLIQSIDAASGLFEGVWGAYCMPSIRDFNGDGKPELLWAGQYHHGLTTLDAKVLWCQPGGAGPATAADIDGDGKLELASAGWKDGKGLRILDAATGKKRWDFELPSNAGIEIVAADIDGDGIEEFVFPVGSDLYALNTKGGEPHLVWRAPLPSPATELALADVDGDDKAEILYVGNDSTLYCLNGSE